MENHVQTVCPQTVVNCKYAEFGCEYQVILRN